ncbi:hypothetical protein ACRAWD_29220 [Caulobacter segnis]
MRVKLAGKSAAEVRAEIVKAASTVRSAGHPRRSPRRLPVPGPHPRLGQ